MKKIAFLFVAISLAVASPALGEEQLEPVTTYDLIGSCMDTVYQDETLTTKTFCSAFIRGAVDAHKFLSSSFNCPLNFCLPAEVNDKQMIGVLISYVREHPELSEKSAILTLYYAFNDAFPCPESQTSR